MRLILPPLLLLALTAASTPALRSTPSLGMASGRCRAHEAGPAIMIRAIGLKDRTGVLRAELYPPNDKDFLADDNMLIAAGKTFERVEADIPPSGTPTLCIRAPAPGDYSLALIHDRDGDRKFSLLHDGIGFAGNHPLGFGKPTARSATITVPAGVIETDIIMNYRHGLLSFAPLGSRP